MPRRKTKRGKIKAREGSSPTPASIQSSLVARQPSWPSSTHRERPEGPSRHRPKTKTSRNLLRIPVASPEPAISSLSPHPRITLSGRHHDLSDDRRDAAPRREATISGLRRDSMALPDRLRAGTEHLSGLDLGDVEIRYDSDRPSSLGSFAFARGNEIHLGPNQERHLAHELWHVVQQKQGRVKPTLQVKGVAINDDPRLEREADTMASKVIARRADSPGSTWPPRERLGRRTTVARPVVQRAITYPTPADENTLNANLVADWKSISRYTHGEALTNSVGDESDTSNFTDGAYQRLERVPIRWGDGKLIGEMRPIGKTAATGNFDPGVKMHLVNSFLHRDANNWAENWVWGHAALNHDHEQKIENKAKDIYHPSKGGTLSTSEQIKAMIYRTEVIDKADYEVKSDDDMASHIVDQINLRATFGFAGTDLDTVKDQVKVDGKDVNDYQADWQTAVTNTVASKLKGFVKIYGVDATSKVIAEDVDLDPDHVEVKDPVFYKAVIRSDLDQWFANNVFKLMDQGRPKRSRRRTGNADGDGSGAATKKGKPAKLNE